MLRCLRFLVPVLLVSAATRLLDSPLANAQPEDSPPSRGANRQPSTGQPPARRNATLHQHVVAMHEELNSISLKYHLALIQRREQLSGRLFNITRELNQVDRATNRKERWRAERSAAELLLQMQLEFRAFKHDANKALAADTLRLLLGTTGGGSLGGLRESTNSLIPATTDRVSLGSPVESKAYVRVFYGTIRKGLKQDLPTVNAPRYQVGEGWLRCHSEDFKPMPGGKEKLKPAPHTRFTEEIGELVLGQCEVEITVPTNVLKAMDIKHYEVRVGAALDAQTEFKLVSHLPKTKFVEKLRDRVAKSKGREVFVFVHGYRNSFKQAMVGTARMAFAFKHDGAPIAFAWPADFPISISGYHKAQAQADAAAAALADFLRNVVQQAKPERIHVIAHSLGTDLLSRALHKIAKDDGPSATEKAALPLTTVVLAAADVDLNDFKDHYAMSVLDLAKAVVLYVARNDPMLGFSRLVNKNRMRLGDASDAVPLIAGASTIVVSEMARGVDIAAMHSYHMRTPPVLRDFDGVLQGVSLNERGLQKRSESGQAYYYLAK